MKLRNKKTSEIGNLVLNINQNRESYSVISTENGDTVCGNLVLADYDSLAELVKEWEDVPKEPKGCWIVNIFGVVGYTHFRNEAEAELLKEIGNYFETREEAEKAVEKLKAWKRLKDKGFKFGDWRSEEGAKLKFPGGVVYDAHYSRSDASDDLNLLFGGKE